MPYQTFEDIACPNPKCRNWLFRKSSDENWRFKVKALRVDKDGADVIAICKSCGSEVKLPMLLVPREDQQEAMVKSNSGFRVEKVKSS